MSFDTSTHRVLNHSSEASMLIDEQGLILSCNDSCLQLFDYQEDQVLGQPIQSICLQEQAQLCQTLQAYLQAPHQQWQSQKLLIKTAHGPKKVQMSIVGIDDQGSMMHHVIFIDLSMQQRADEAEKMLAAVVDTADQAIIRTDLQGKVIKWNQGATALYKHTEQQMLGQQLDVIIPPAQRGETEHLLSVIVSGGLVDHYETERLDDAGNILQVLVNASPLADEEEQIVGMTLLEKDVTENKQMQSQLEYLADHDQMTGLYNRRHFQEALEERLASKKPGAMAIFDLDHFKYINDAHGHTVGDKILKRLAALLEDNCAADEPIAHLGSDEFAVLYNHNGKKAERRTEEIIDKISEQLTVGGRIGPAHKIRASAGVVRFDQQAKADDLLVCADLALFSAKEDGGGKVVTYDSSRGSTIQQAEMLQRALEEERLVLYAQPIMNIKTSQIDQYELLLRVRDDQELVSAASFLAAAERLGMIGTIDRWVVQQGLRLAAEGKSVEINLSAQSMNDPNFPSEIADQLQSTGADPNKVIFEITETAAIASMDDAVEFINQLRKLGCQFALDDFGTGFGSFSHIKHLPVTVLKIDGEFIRNICDNVIDREVVKAIVSVAQAMGHKTVAEWVGDQQTLDVLTELGVDYAQGYFIGQPAPIERAIS